MFFGLIMVIGEHFYKFKPAEINPNCHATRALFSSYMINIYVAA